MRAGIILISFGEPATAEPEAVRDYLAKIFFANAELEGAKSDEERWARSHLLAERRAPSLIAAYEEIGGSPLNAQAETQARGLQQELLRRGFDAKTYIAMQYTPPSIKEAVAKAQKENINKLIAIPIYPLCGPSTNVMALEGLRAEIAAIRWNVPLYEITGWHRHLAYTRLRAENIANYARINGISFEDSKTRLIFSAHGTPQHYLKAGSRYVLYVEEYCKALAALLGALQYELGYQNHSNRKIEWTQPNIEDVISSLNLERVKRVIIEPVSFMHEQSETLAELDHELREAAEGRGLEFYRVPIPYEHPDFFALLADLAEPFITQLEPAYYQLRQCRCKPTAGTFCLNAPIK